MVFVSILIDIGFIFIGPQHEKLMGLQVNNHMFHAYWSKFQFTLALSLMIQISRLMVLVSYLLVNILHTHRGCRLMIQYIMSIDLGFKFGGLQVNGSYFNMNGISFIFIGPQQEKLTGLQINDHIFHVHWSKFQLTSVLSLIIQILRLMVLVSYLLVNIFHTYRGCRLMIQSFMFIDLSFIFHRHHV